MAEHRRLRRKSTSLGNELDEAEWAKGHPPSELITWRNYTTSGGAIKHRRDQLLSEAGANAEQIELEYRKAKADERARKRARREWYKRNGLADLKAKYNEISGAENVALFDLTEIRPTTIAGVGALITYLRRDITMGSSPWQEEALANAARALLQMPNETPPPVVSESMDLDLANAISDMHNADAAIDRLYDKYGDDADRREDYQQVETEREKALGTLATKKARSSNGLVAKAEALTVDELRGDFNRHGEIAVSLAEDVLCFFHGRVV